MFLRRIFWDVQRNRLNTYKLCLIWFSIKTCYVMWEASVVENMARFMGYCMTEWSWIGMAFLLVLWIRHVGWRVPSCDWLESAAVSQLSDSLSLSLCLSMCFTGTYSTHLQTREWREEDRHDKKINNERKRTWTRETEMERVEESGKKQGKWGHREMEKRETDRFSLISFTDIKCQSDDDKE